MIYNVPGVYVTEGTFGATPTPLSRHDSVYIFVTSSIDQLSYEPRYITSLADFTNVFGSSPSTKNIELFFLQNPEVGIWVSSVKASNQYPFTLDDTDVTEGDTYGFTINGLEYSTVATASDTAMTINTRIQELVNNTSPDAFISGFVLRLMSGTVTATGFTLGSMTTDTVSTLDAAATMLKVFRNDENLIPGFIIAPEFYELATNGTEHAYLASIAEQSAIVLGGVSLVDSRLPAASTAELLAERALLSSPRGHSAYYFPYLVDGKGRNVAPSSVVAAINIKAQKTSYATPAAGNSLPIAGITGLSRTINHLEQGVLNPEGINVIRFFSNKGFIIYGARTLSTSSFYTFTTTRVILNVLARSLTLAFNDLILTGLTYGLAFSVAKSTATSICELMRQNGSLFGSKPDEAYRVIADNTNNTLTNLDQGQLFVDVIVKPTPVTEVISIRLNRASLGASLTGTNDVTSAATVATESIIKPQV